MTKAPEQRRDEEAELAADVQARAAMGMKAALTGLGVNIILVVVKLVAGIAGHSYALIADAIESSTDLFSSLIVWGGLRITIRPADDDYPYGYGKAEALAGAVVAGMLLVASLGIAAAAVTEIITPHHMPAAFTLAVLVAVIVIKEALFRTVLAVGHETDSTAVKADAWHHRSDAITSLAAFIGIAVALWGGEGWESADDWAALVAAGIIALNGLRMLRPAVRDLMDRMPDGPIVDHIATTARGVEGVRAIEKLRVRKQGLTYAVDLHVQADPSLSLYDAHDLSHIVKRAIHDADPNVSSILIHMEPYDDEHPPQAGPNGTAS